LISRAGEQFPGPRRRNGNAGLCPSAIIPNPATTPTIAITHPRNDTKELTTSRFSFWASTTVGAVRCRRILLAHSLKNPPYSLPTLPNRPTRRGLIYGCRRIAHGHLALGLPSEVVHDVHQLR
jgi:hypothetical protein